MYQTINYYDRAVLCNNNIPVRVFRTLYTFKTYDIRK